MPIMLLSTVITNPTDFLKNALLLMLIQLCIKFISIVIHMELWSFKNVIFREFHQVFTRIVCYYEPLWTSADLRVIVCLWFEESKSATTKQSNFPTNYDKNPLSRSIMYQWHKCFVKAECSVRYEKSSARHKNLL